MDEVVPKSLSLATRRGLSDPKIELGQRFFTDVGTGADLSGAPRRDARDGAVDLIDAVTQAYSVRRYKMIEALPSHERFAPRVGDRRRPWRRSSTIRRSFSRGAAPDHDPE